jgi:hypothetical protein
MLLYRYENNNGIGPYMAPFCGITSKLNDFHNDSSHPSIYEDFKEHIYSGKLYGGRFWDYLSACTSIEAFKKWFEGFHGVLHEHGFKPFVFSIKDSSLIMGVSCEQALFKRFDGVIIGQVPRELLY